MYEVKENIRKWEAVLYNAIIKCEYSLQTLHDLQSCVVVRVYERREQKSNPSFIKHFTDIKPCSLNNV